MRIIKSTLFNDMENREMSVVSVVMDTGDIYHLFSLADGVHWSRSSEYRGRYETAVEQEMKSPNAQIIAIDEVKYE